MPPRSISFRFIFAVAVIATALSATSVRAQVEMPQQPTRQVSQQPTVNLNASPPNVGALMKNSNGSLYRAVANMPDDPRLIKPADVSYFSIAAPKPKTLQKHDLLTIVVREESSFKSDGKTNGTKTAALDAKLEQFPAISLADMALKAGIGSTIPELKLSADRNFSNDGSVDRKDTFTARIQSEVVDVKPNGTLVVQARKRIVTDDEEQLFVLTGVCRVQDVTADNSVLSTQLYDLDVKKTHTGAVRDATKRGWIPRAMDWLSPW